MKINNIHYKTIEYNEKECLIIDQTYLPFKTKIIRSTSWKTTKDAISKMQIRGAGAIGAAGAVAMAQASKTAEIKDYEKYILNAKNEIIATRPTAQNLFEEVEKVYQSSLISPSEAQNKALEILEEIEKDAIKIAEYGNTLINDGSVIMTHCNAGWLAFVDWGSALAPIYYAVREGKKVFVWVSETRPRLQGSRLTSFELQNENIPHKIFCDNATAYIMKNEKVDFVITGADRIALNGDTANKIGTYEKAILAKHFDIPFYIAANKSTFDKNCKTGKDIPIEFRSEDEIIKISGQFNNSFLNHIYVSAKNDAFNPAFDVTEKKFITAYITESGIHSSNSFNINAIK